MQERNGHAPRLSELSTEQRDALLRKLRAERSNARSQAPVISRDSDEGSSAPLSIPQEHMWLHHRLSPESAAYRMPLSVRLRGSADWSALAASLTDLVARHAALRTVYRQEGLELVQVELPARAVELPIDVVQGATQAEREQHALALGRAEVARPFDLERGPVLRARAFALAPDDHILLVTVHHIAADGWSLGILANELSHFYLARRRDEAPSLPAPAIRYSDFARWQRAEASSPGTLAMLDYWRKQLGDGQHELALPLDRRRVPGRSQNSGQIEVTISDDLARAVRSLAERSNASPFMVLLAALQLLLGRYADQEQVTIGTPIANRTQPETHEVVGLFVNVLALRADLSQARSFADLLHQTRRVALEAYERQALPFQSVVDAVAPDRSAGDSSLFRALLALLNTPPVTARVDGLEIEPFVVESGAADHDLVLSLAPRSLGYYGALHYNSSLWTAASMQGLVEHYLWLLALVTEDPSRSLTTLKLVRPEDERRIAAWNQTAVELDAEEFVHRAFERRAALRPDAEALCFEGRTISYGRLNGAANRLAEDLRAMGHGRGSIIAVALPRSPELVLGMLAALKLGAAYMPLDPAWPEQRLQSALSDASARIVIAGPGFDRNLGPHIERLRLSPEAAWDKVLPNNLTVQLSHADLAYIITTSGSTGAPKAAMNSHGALLNRLLWQQAEIPIGEVDRVLHKTPSTFDVSVWELIWPLMMGATMVIARPEGHREADYLVELVRRERVSVAHFVPSMLEAFIDLLRPAPASLRVVIASGEALPPALVNRFYDAASAARLYNLYGPAEAAIDVTYWPCTAETATATVPLGRPVANTSIYVVDRHLQSVPIGVPGEICIGGRNVGLGYAGRPEWTAERFVPDPFAGRASAVMYRTGDVGRWRADGTLEFIGRRDHQVKVRGHRIELGEIEAAALRLPGVRAAVAVVAPQRGGELVLYVVGTAGEARDGTALLELLRHELPPAMLPRRTIEIDALPLTSSGKIDRRALPDPEPAAPKREVPLASVFEQTLAKLWSDVLGTTVEGQNAHFFELGGHSVSLARLGARLQNTFGVDVPLRTLFDAPSLDAMADAVLLTLLAGVPGQQRESLLWEVEALSAEQAEQQLTAEGWF